MIDKQNYVKQHFGVLISLLRDRQGFLEEIRQEVRLQNKISSLFVTSSIFFAIYGAIIGASHSFAQSLSSTIKLPVFYLLTLIICFPTLFFFNVLFGSRSTFKQHFVVLLTAVSVISVLLFSLAPVTLFFMITAPDSYQFFKLLNVLIFGITGTFGVKFLYEGMQLLSEDYQNREKQIISQNAEKNQEEDDDKYGYEKMQLVYENEFKSIPENKQYKGKKLTSQNNENGKKTRTTILRFWLLLYGFVGVQLGWFLRPFFGAPGTEFQLFRTAQGNFYLDVLHAISQILGGR
jgi:hypothetical protein